jgi:hypothetical protein
MHISVLALLLIASYVLMSICKRPALRGSCLLEFT